MGEKGDMPFLAHVGVLRKHILRALVVIIIAAAAVGYKIHYVMDHIIFAPVKPDFISFKILNYIGNNTGVGDLIKMPEHFPILVRRAFEQLNTAFYVSFVLGFIIAFPYVMYEIWKFLDPALKPREKKNSLSYFFSVYILFIIGCLFGYFFVFPMTMQFAYFFHLSDMINLNIDLSSYISILLQTVIGMGLVFLFPILVYVLTSIGLLEPSFLKRYRRHSLIIILILAGFITPGDIPSMLVASVPLYGLYEFSILVSTLVMRRIKREEEINQ